MAKSALTSLLVVFSFLLVMSIVQSAPPVVPTVADPICQKVYAVHGGETCSVIIQKFKLDQSHFLEINPNINCASIFVGQWVCIQGQVV
ncbi:hypothetical protein L6164_037372 [Bauhinia variegata]|uniref:Uncharacterized protein n=1 Tax=Bauhinia variegata TaxID=167791 RepID=A0ACB9KJS8_BAUVA|nr:hypothetical protein L6164_037372 [Bauhinia variegata]